MADPSGDAGQSRVADNEAAAYLDMSAQRRALAKAHAAMLGQTAGRVAMELPLAADVDDFRRVLAAGAKPETKP
jgi:hypothetical protein